jgi:hypothetical protein
VRFGEPLVSRLLNTTKIVYMLGIIPQVAVRSDVQRAVLLPLVIEVATLLVRASDSASVELAEGTLTDLIVDEYANDGDFAVKLAVVRYATAFFCWSEWKLKKVREALEIFEIAGLIMEFLESDVPLMALKFLRVVLTRVSAGLDFDQRFIREILGQKCEMALLAITEEESEMAEKAEWILTIMNEQSQSQG